VPLIEVRGLTKLYRMGDSIVRALDGVDLTVERGEFVAITGASGSGKSTMMHVLGCLDRPTSGIYRLDGRDVSALSDRELAEVRNQRIGFVFQTFNLINRITAWENVAVPLFYARKTNTRPAAMRALERVGLLDRAMHQPNELSGGERQRVAIARAIVNDPILLLADEPTGNLDTRTGEQIMGIFRSLNEQGVTIIMVTHELDIAEHARRIVQMRDGRILSDQLTAEVIAARGHARPRKLPSTEMTPVAAVPVSAAQPPASTPPPMPPRMLPGATATLVCGVVAIVLWLAAVAVQFTLGRLYHINPEEFDPARPKLPPMPVLVGSGLASLAMLIGIVFGIVAVVLARGVRRRAREEVANWQGRRRAVVGAVFGWITILVPAVLVLTAIIKLIVSGAPKG